MIRDGTDISFHKNGVSLGVAFNIDISEDIELHPYVDLYKQDQQITSVDKPEQRITKINV